LAPDSFANYSPPFLKLFYLYKFFFQDSMYFIVSLCFSLFLLSRAVPAWLLSGGDFRPFDHRFFGDPWSCASELTDTIRSLFSADRLVELAIFSTALLGLVNVARSGIVRTTTASLARLFASNARRCADLPAPAALLFALLFAPVSVFRDIFVIIEAKMVALKTGGTFGAFFFQWLPIVAILALFCATDSLFLSLLGGITWYIGVNADGFGPLGATVADFSTVNAERILADFGLLSSDAIIFWRNDMGPARVAFSAVVLALSAAGSVQILRLSLRILCAVGSCVRFMARKTPIPAFSARLCALLADLRRRACTVIWHTRVQIPVLLMLFTVGFALLSNDADTMLSAVWTQLSPQQFRTALGLDFESMSSDSPLSSDSPISSSSSSSSTILGRFAKSSSSILGLMLSMLARPIVGSTDARDIPIESLGQETVDNDFGAHFDSVITVLWAAGFAFVLLTVVLISLWRLLKDRFADLSDSALCPGVVFRDIARLEEVAMARVFTPRSAACVQRIVKRAAREGRCVSFFGQRHTMGGHCVASGAGARRFRAASTRGLAEDWTRNPSTSSSCWDGPSPTRPAGVRGFAVDMRFLSTVRCESGEDGEFVIAGGGATWAAVIQAANGIGW
jgi:hypothetical protein